MLQDIFIGAVMVLLTTAMHAGAMMLAIHAVGGRKQKIESRAGAFPRMVAISVVVLIMFLASLFEAAAWGALFVFRGAITDTEAAMYFSVVTYTTLGYGDVTLTPDHRMLAAFEAANGIMMFGWTTAVIVAVVQRVYAPPGAADSEH